MVPRPLITDVDGTLTDDAMVLDDRIGPALRAWPGPVVIATGKSLPYPIALCNYLGLDRLVVAENGGVAISEPTETLEFVGDRAAAEAVLAEYEAAGYSDGWGTLDLANRWRETELVFEHSIAVEPLREIAAEHGLEVVDTQYAYHVKSPDVSKGRAVERIATDVGFDLDRAVAIGDSANDVSTFERAGTAIAVANAPAEVQAAADHVTSDGFADGFLDALDRVQSGAWG
ncbi:phosphoglycolate phosphatase [Halococcoides cellulosivorans]|uniref:Phosphoglycolate phosphatase n=1 Tax=Halococcoides cellulosivorans TaxID=1679096 RepID=A0A2R4X484_9EURY|nr:phosphoglycolate phosphatase [Halococcoides cellulosivorans]AWB28614.1 phosphoglycolate phosphatase [Halococcoides cellulosivorans]